jgi:hypothetical protein
MAEYDYKGPQFGLAGLRSALDKLRIKLQGPRAEDQSSERVAIGDEDLEGLIFEPPNKLLRPGAAKTSASAVYVNIRSSDGTSTNSWTSSAPARSKVMWERPNPALMNLDGCSSERSRGLPVER